MAREENKYLLAASGRFTTIFTVFLLCGVCAIGAVFVYYTNDVISNIQDNEAKIARTYTKIWQLVASDSVSGPVTSVLFDEVILKSNFPIVITDSLEQPLFWKALPDIPDNADKPDTKEKVRKRLADMKARKGEIPIYVDSVVICKLFYDDNALIGRLRLIPIVEMGMVLGFIILALVGFQHIRRSEQRSIWVGMAKETAHQLGTPISSLLGWVNLLRTGDTTYSPNEIYRRVDLDLARLETIANRFGKIGSMPKMEKGNINTLTNEVVVYYRERLPHSGQGVRIDFVPGEVPETNVNPELYRWVVENLLKNSLEAVDAKTGVITIRVRPSASRKQVVIEVTDNGRGIPRGDARRIFRPGYTTKKRGWGLGLSLARRIITEYHKGEIFLAKSEPGKGATFTIRLPLK
jgi:two-component system, NtrC family, sensor histidine kinase KinB